MDKDDEILFGLYTSMSHFHRNTYYGYYGYLTDYNITSDSRTILLMKQQKCNPSGLAKHYQKAVSYEIKNVIPLMFLVLIKYYISLSI